MLLDTVQILQDKNKSFKDLDKQIQFYCIFSILDQLSTNYKFYIKIKLFDENEKIDYDEVNKKIDELLTQLKILEYVEYKGLNSQNKMEYILKDKSYLININKKYDGFINEIHDTFKSYKRNNEYKEIFYTKVKHLYSVKGNNLELRQSDFKEFKNFPFTEIILYLIHLKYIELLDCPIIFFTDGKIDLKYHFELSKEFENIIKKYNPKEDISKILDITEDINRKGIIFYDDFVNIQIGKIPYKIQDIINIDSNYKKGIILLYTILKEGPKKDINDYLSPYIKYNKEKFNGRNKNITKLDDQKSRLKQIGKIYGFELKNDTGYFDISLT